MRIKSNLVSLLLILFSTASNAQKIDFWIADYEKVACFSSNVLFNTTIECPISDTCFYVIDYGDKKIDTLPSNRKPRHLYSNDGMYNVNIRMLKISDSSEIMSRTFNKAVSVYSPTGASINHSIEVDNSYILTYNIANFDPHDTAAWQYIWTFHDNTSIITDTLHQIVTKEYTEENIEPGYLVSLRIEMKETDATSLISDLDQCFDTISTFVPVNDNFFDTTAAKEPLLFNVITPDGNPNDGSSANDVFKVSTNGHDVFTLTIFNNYGNVVYTQTGKDATWTGVTNSGRRVKSGTYYYAIESNASGEKHRTTGFVHVFNED